MPLQMAILGQKLELGTSYLSMSNVAIVENTQQGGGSVASTGRALLTAQGGGSSVAEDEEAAGGIFLGSLRTLRGITGINLN